MVHFSKIKLLKYFLWNNTELFFQIRAEGRFNINLISRYLRLDLPMRPTTTQMTMVADKPSDRATWRQKPHDNAPFGVLSLAPGRQTESPTTLRLASTRRTKAYQSSYHKWCSTTRTIQSVHILKNGPDLQYETSINKMYRLQDFIIPHVQTQSNRVCNSYVILLWLMLPRDHFVTRFL
jgi:hypothetical protein